MLGIRRSLEGELVGAAGAAAGAVAEDAAEVAVAAVEEHRLAEAEHMEAAVVVAAQDQPSQESAG